MSTYIFVIIIIIMIYLFNRRKNKKYITLTKVLAHDLQTLPLIGIAHLFYGNGEALFKALKTLGHEALNKNGKICVWFVHRAFIVIADPVVAEIVSKSCLEKHEIMTKCAKELLGNGIVIAPVELWRPHRKMLIPAFSPKSLQTYVTTFAAKSNSLVEQLQPCLDQSLPMFDYVMRYFMETIFETSLGVQLNLKADTNHPFMCALKEGSLLVGKRLLQPWLHPDCIYRHLASYSELMRAKENADQFLKSIIEKQMKRKKLENNSSGPMTAPFLDQLIELSRKDKSYSIHQLREEILTLMVAGIETSAVAAGCICVMIARHPDVQEKIYRELSSVFADHRPVSAEDLPQLQYLDAVIRETLRLYPPAPIAVREVHQDIQLPCGVVVPQGCGVVIHLWAINRNPDFWGADADQFRPERFLNSRPKHQAQFATFSLGPRNCMGNRFAMLSLQTMFATLLRSYRLSPAVPTPNDMPSTTSCEETDESMRLTFGVTIKDINKFPIVLHLRNK